MTAEHAVIDRLKATAAVTALVSTRIWMLILPQTPQLPAIRVQLIAEPVSKHLRGPDGTRASRVQVDCYALATSGDPYAAVAAIADASDAALVNEPFTVGTVRVLNVERVDRRVIYEADELRLVRMLLDYRVWSQTIES